MSVLRKYMPQDEEKGVTKTLVNQDGEIKKRIMSMFHADDPSKPEIEK